jgi:hypothetical protein
VSVGEDVDDSRSAIVLEAEAEAEERGLFHAPAEDSLDVDVELLED